MIVCSSQINLESLSLDVRFDEFYQQIKAVILARQNPVTGRLPASTAANARGDYTDAWVRDNVYSILAVWGLALAYRKVDAEQGRTFELEGCVVNVYSKRTRAFVGKILRYEPNHTFPGGAVEAGVLIAGSDGQTGCYPVRTLDNTFTLKR